MLFKVGSKVERHYENTANTFDSMCTLYLECFVPVIEEHFRTKKYEPPLVTTWNWPTSTVHNRQFPDKSLLLESLYFVNL